MDNENTTLKETILKAYFENGISKEEILKKHLIGADTLNFWIKERETEDGRVGKKPSEEPINYESEADDDFHIFLKKERFLLDMPHYHESVELICVLKGSARAHVGEKVFQINSGEICFSNRFQNHFYENQSRDLEAICVVLSHNFTHHFRQAEGDKTPPAYMKNTEYNQKIIELLQKWLDEKDKSFLLNCAYSNLLFDLLIKTYGLSDSVKTDSDRLAVKFIDYIENNYRSDISLTTMAKHFGYTKEYCSKLFNKSVGQHFNTFLNSVRVRKAEEMMNSKEGENRKITDIIYECGFTNQVTFYRHYKADKGERTKRS